MQLKRRFRWMHFVRKLQLMSIAATSSCTLASCVSCSGCDPVLLVWVLCEYSISTTNIADTGYMLHGWELKWLPSPYFRYQSLTVWDHHWKVNDRAIQADERSILLAQVYQILTVIWSFEMNLPCDMAPIGDWYINSLAV